MAQRMQYAIEVKTWDNKTKKLSWTSHSNHMYILTAKADTKIEWWKTVEVLTGNKILVPEWYVWLVIYSPIRTADWKLDTTYQNLIQPTVQTRWNKHRSEIWVMLHNANQWYAKVEWSWTSIKVTRIAWTAMTIKKWTEIAKLLIVKSATADTTNHKDLPDVELDLNPMMYNYLK